MKKLACVALISLLSGCDWFAKPAPPSPPKAPPQPARDVVKEIRAEAAKAGALLVIEPVANPAVASLLAQAEKADEVGNHAAAAELSKQAWVIDASNPVVLQFRAEVFLRAGSMYTAETYAKKSYAGSAQLGPLCVRNWLVLAEVARAKSDATAEQEARNKAADCPAKPIQRL
jgi:hypothetical protein